MKAKDISLIVLGVAFQSADQHHRWIMEEIVEEFDRGRRENFDLAELVEANVYVTLDKWLGET